MSKISPKFVPKGQIDNSQALVLIMAWCCPANKPLSEPTRTTRMPAFWGYPPPPHDYPYHWVILDPKSKEDKVKVTNLKNLPKFQIFWILKRTLHSTHLLKLLDNMCKYEMDPMSIVEDTEQTRFCPQTDRRTDGQGDTSIPLSTSLKRGGIIILIYNIQMHYIDLQLRHLLWNCSQVNATEHLW